MTPKRLIEEAFPLKQASLDSVHEKNVRHGHISTLHIWPARRPLAASRAALIAALLPDPGDSKSRAELVRRIGGDVVSVRKTIKQKDGTVVDKVAEETVGGILHWGREQEPDLAFFREEIRRAFGGRALKVLDMFAGGGAIPLEAMRTAYCVPQGHASCSVGALLAAPAFCRSEVPSPNHEGTHPVNKTPPSPYEGEGRGGVVFKTVSQSEYDTLIEALMTGLYCVIAKGLDYNNQICAWYTQNEQITHLFKRFAIPMNWDFAEANFTVDTSGGYEPFIDWVVRAIETSCRAANANMVHAVNGSATEPVGDDLFDAIVTDPPYYDAIPYSDLSDFFYVWLRRPIGDANGPVFAEPLTPKPEELVQHTGRFGNLEEARKFYEDGMADAFRAACRALKPDGRMVIVFAHKQPDAWETLVAAMIRAGFVVTASWPIDTEMGNRTRAQNSAALASSVWLVCRKRPADAGKGWYKQVQPRMKERITERLRYFWDIGVRGPDFLWAAIGPGLEAFSAYDEVRRNDGKPFTVPEFLKEVRRLTTDFALGQIVTGGTEGLDEWTRYALMHAANFGAGGAPVGECILLAGAYGLDLNSLTGPRGILVKGKTRPAPDEEEEDTDPPADHRPPATASNADPSQSEGSGSELRLMRWDERKRDDLGEPHPALGLPYIDMLHRLTREWASGDVSLAADYSARHGLGQNDLFWRVAQAFVEMSEPQSRERTLLEAIIAWGRGRSLSAPLKVAEPKTMYLVFDE